MKFSDLEDSFCKCVSRTYKEDTFYLSTLRPSCYLSLIIYCDPQNKSKYQ